MSTVTLDHNVEAARPNATSAPLDHNVEAGRPNATSGALDHDAAPRAPVLTKPKELQKNNKLGQGIVAEHFDAGSLRADAVGRAVIAANFFDAATFAAKVADGAIPIAKITVPAPPSGAGQTLVTTGVTTASWQTAGAPAFSGIKLTKGANQSIQNFTTTDIVFNASDLTEWLLGTDFSHNPSGAHPEEITVNVACKVEAILFALWLNMPANTFAEAYIVRSDSGRNVVEAIGLNINAPSGSGVHPMASLSAEMDCAIGDLIKFQVVQITGGALNVRGGAGKGWTSISVRKIS